MQDKDTKAKESYNLSPMYGGLRKREDPVKHWLRQFAREGILLAGVV